MKKYCNVYLDKLASAKKLSTPKERQNASFLVIKEIKVAAEANSREAVIAWSYLQLVGYKVELNLVEAKERLSSLISKQRCPEAMFFVAMAFYHGELEYPSDKVTSEQYFRELSISEQIKISKRKKARAAAIVSDFYLDGKLVTEDRNEAARFLTIASMNGCKVSLLKLGRIYLKGANGVFGAVFEKNIKKGLQILDSLAAENNADAIEEIMKYHVSQAIYWSKVGRKSNSASDLVKSTASVLETIEWTVVD